MSQGSMYHQAIDFSHAGKCEGGCGKHRGKIMVCRITTPSGHDWGYWSYCEAARDEDRSRGLKVREVPDANATAGGYPFAPGTERFWESPEGWPEAVFNGDRALEALTRVMFDGCNPPSAEAVLIALETGRIPGFVDARTIVEHHRTI